VSFDLPVGKRAVPDIMAAIRALADALRTETPGLEVQFVGGITMMSAFSEAARKDAATCPSFVVQFALLILILGSERSSSAFCC
jgi:hypothetical protein